MPKKISTHAPRFDFVQTKVKKKPEPQPPSPWLVQQNKTNQIKLSGSIFQKKIFFGEREKKLKVKKITHTQVSKTPFTKNKIKFKHKT